MNARAWPGLPPGLPDPGSGPPAAGPASLPALDVVHLGASATLQRADVLIVVEAEGVQAILPPNAQSAGQEIWAVGANALSATLVTVDGSHIWAGSTDLGTALTYNGNLSNSAHLISDGAGLWFSVD